MQAIDTEALPTYLPAPGIPFLDRHGQPVHVGCRIRTQYRHGRDSDKLDVAAGEIVGFGMSRAPRDVFIRLLEPHVVRTGGFFTSPRKLQAGEIMRTTVRGRLDHNTGLMRAHHVPVDADDASLESFIDIVGWSPEHLPGMLTGEKVVSLMRHHQVTIDDLASSMGITKTRVREVREQGVHGKAYVLDWLEGLGAVQAQDLTKAVKAISLPSPSLREPLLRRMRA